MFTYIKIVGVLMYFIERGRIEAIEGEIQPSDWPELSENQYARTNSSVAAAERIPLSEHQKFMDFSKCLENSQSFPEHGECPKKSDSNVSFSKM
jgi:hypothetical protein